MKVDYEPTLDNTGRWRTRLAVGWLPPGVDEIYSSAMNAQYNVVYPFVAYLGEKTCRNTQEKEHRILAIQEMDYGRKRYVKIVLYQHFSDFTILSIVPVGDDEGLVPDFKVNYEPEQCEPFFQTCAEDGYAVAAYLGTIDNDPAFLLNQQGKLKVGYYSIEHMEIALFDI